MIELLGTERLVIEPLCAEREEEVTIFSSIEGHMGKVWADDKDKPICTMVLACDFFYIMGKYTEKESDGIVKILANHRNKIVIMDLKEWSPLAQRLEKEFPESYKSFLRYALNGNKEWFDKEKLHTFVDAIDSEYTIERIDERLYALTLESDWTMDYCSNYLSYEEFKNYGIGYLILKDGEIIAGASSYGYCKGMLEITIETKMNYRRKGLALACASKVILESLDRDIYPRWDAANLNSVALAEKLGYRFSHEYRVYEI